MNCFFFLPDDTTLVTVVPLHVEVTVVSDGKNMRRQFTNLLIGVLSNLVRCVDRQQLVRVHSHQDGASVRLQREEQDVQRKTTSHTVEVVSHQIYRRVTQTNRGNTLDSMDV